MADYKNKITLILLFLILLFNNGFAQFKKGLFLQLGFASSQTDKRVGDFPINVKDNINKSITSNDDEYSILLTKEIFTINKLNIKIGFGYSLIHNDFSTLFSEKYFSGSDGGTFIYKYIDNYYQHNIQNLVALNYSFYKSNNCELGFGFDGISTINFHKKINKIFNKSNIFFNSVEIYPKLFFGYKKILVELNFRIFNYQRNDKALGENEHKWENLNLNKLKFNFVYKI